MERESAWQNSGDEERSLKPSSVVLPRTPNLFRKDLCCSELSENLPTWDSEAAPVLIRIRSATIQHRAWTDARRRDSLRTVFGGLSYCPFTVHFLPKTGYIRWNALKQAKRLTARLDSKHAGLAQTV
jgi:hypothetical protein